MRLPLIDQIFPRHIATYPSPINGFIKIYRSGSHYSLRINGLHQSGQLAYRLWRTAFLRIKDCKVKTVLVLGLGGGSVVDCLNQFWPEATITGIELDPLMIKLGKQYLHLNQAKNLHIIITDAFWWIKKNSHQFDLIIMDLFHGRAIPPQAKTISFFRLIKNSLHPNGIFIFNHLTKFTKKQEVTNTQALLKQVFGNITPLKLPINILFFAQKPS
jgi:spermidine synthase